MTRAHVLRRRLAALMIGIGCASGGCVTKLSSLPPSFDPTIRAGTVVIGRIEMLRPTGEPLGELISWLPEALAEKPGIGLENERTGRQYSLIADRPGFVSDFYVAMLPGSYRITGTGIGTARSEIRGFLDVPDVPVVYIGTLRFVGEPGGGLFTLFTGRWSVLDAAADVVRRFRERYPRVTDPARTSLMMLGPRRPANRQTRIHVPPVLGQ